MPTSPARADRDEREERLVGFGNSPPTATVLAHAVHGERRASRRGGARAGAAATVSRRRAAAAPASVELAGRLGARDRRPGRRVAAGASARPGSSLLDERILAREARERASWPATGRGPASGSACRRPAGRRPEPPVASAGASAGAASAGRRRSSARRAAAAAPRGPFSIFSVRGPWNAITPSSRTKPTIAIFFCFACLRLRRSPCPWRHQLRRVAGAAAGVGGGVVVAGVVGGAARRGGVGGARRRGRGRAGAEHERVELQRRREIAGSGSRSRRSRRLSTLKSRPSASSAPSRTPTRFRSRKRKSERS